MAVRGGALFIIRYPTRGARKVIEAQAARLPYRWGQMLDRAADIHVEELRSRTPEGKGGRGAEEVGGKLRRGWRVRKIAPGGRLARQVYNTERHLKYVLEGRGAIDQIASGRRRLEVRDDGRKVWRGVLHFWARGREFYRWRVGPAAANPFHREAIRVAGARVRKEMHGAGRAIIINSTSTNG